MLEIIRGKARDFCQDLKVYRAPRRSGDDTSGLLSGTGGEARRRASATSPVQRRLCLQAYPLLKGMAWGRDHGGRSGRGNRGVMIYGKRHIIHLKKNMRLLHSARCFSLSTAVAPEFSLS